MRVGVIGLGRMGRRHVQAVLEMGFEVVGIVDPFEDALKATETEHGVGPSFWYPSLEAMLANAKIELLIIATTAPTHAPYTIAGAEAKIPFILCEKPMATSLADCDAMLKACQVSGSNLAINHPMRFMDDYTKPKEIFDSGQFGEFTSMNITGGNIGMAMNGSHFFEAFRFLAGEGAHEVTAWFSPERIANPRGPEFFDASGQIRFTSKSGKRFYMDIGPDQGHGAIVLYGGSYGLLVSDTIFGQIELSCRVESIRDWPMTRYGGERDHTRVDIPASPVVAPTKKVIEGLITGGDTPRGEDAILAIETLAAAYHSAGNGSRPVIVGSQEIDRSKKFPWA